MAELAELAEVSAFLMYMFHGVFRSVFQVGMADISWRIWFRSSWGYTLLPVCVYLIGGKNTPYAS